MLLYKILTILSFFLIFILYCETSVATSLYVYIQQLCRNLLNKADNKSSMYFEEEAFKKYLQESSNQSTLVLPGTKWCGKGFTSHSYLDLGRFKEVDSCCRRHDLCRIYIDPKSSNYGLNNTTPYTLLHCQCDTDFYKCLKTSNNIISSAVGFAYFTVLNRHCFKKAHPIKSCAKKKKGRCLKYTYDVSGKIEYRWFDNPQF